MKKYKTVEEFERDEHNLRDGQRIRIGGVGSILTYETGKTYEELLYGEPLGVGAMRRSDLLRLLRR